MYCTRSFSKKLAVLSAATLLLSCAALAVTSTRAVMTSPTAGSTFTSTTVKFTWAGGKNVDGYKLFIGSQDGVYDIYQASLGMATSATVSGLPSDGRKLYVKLSSHVPGTIQWLRSYSTYTAYKKPVTGTAAAMTSPVPGSTLGSSSMTFTWNSGTSVSSYSLEVGTSAGGSDLGTYSGTGTSKSITTIPQDGRTVYVKLGSLIGSTWSYNSYTYATANSTSPGASCGNMNVGQGASLNGYVPFSGTSSAWNQDVSGAAVDPNSSAIINYIGAAIGLHPDFSSGLYNGSTGGIPYVVVDGNQQKVPVSITYPTESDPGPMPIPTNAPIEGYPNPQGDKHVLVVDAKNCWLYEIYNSTANNDGSWHADSAAVWDLTSNVQRPYTWTSADAAGLPILPGLIRYDEVASGAINHAIRFTLLHSKRAFVLPATHFAANSTDSLAAPMGMRMRLKASFDVSNFSAANQVILNAMKKYGIIMADNGSNMYITGTPDDRWNNDDLHNLGLVHTSDFEVVQMGTVYTDSNMPSGPAPTISSFTASAATVASGGSVTLNFVVTGAEYVIVNPEAGPVRGTSVTVHPSQTTTYTINATNQFGRSTKSVTVTVQ